LIEPSNRTPARSSAIAAEPAWFWFGGAKLRLRRIRKCPLAGIRARRTERLGQQLTPGPAKKADEESKAVKLPGNGRRSLFFFEDVL